MLAIVFLTCCALFVIAYLTYGSYLDRRYEIEPGRPTPAHTERDGVDYVPTPNLILFGHHFSSIAGAGPIVGPIIAGMAFGWLPALLWIVIGSIFVGGVHDYTSLMASLRHRGRSIGQICKQYLSPYAFYSFLLFVWFAMIYILIVFLDLTATSFAPITDFSRMDAEARATLDQGGNVATASILYILIALLLGVVLNRLRVRLGPATLFFVPLVFLALWVGQFIPLSADKMPVLLGSPKNTWSAVLLLYCFAASLAPVWVLLQPRDYLSSFLLFACLFGGMVGLLISGTTGRLEIAYPAFTTFNDPTLGFLFPVLFITIACGAVSGFHSIVASGTTAKQLRNEGSAKRISYGAMLVEGVLAIVALSAVMIVAERPEGMTPVAIFASGIGRFVSVFGLSPDTGMTFGLLAVSTFLLTTLDTCTRLGRFVFEELLELKGLRGRVFGTVATLAIPAVVVFVEITGPDGAPVPAWMAVWPAFGSSNQLLAALALLVGYVWLKHLGSNTLFIIVPMVFMCVTTLTALTQLAYRNLIMDGSLFLGVLSTVLVLLAVSLFIDTIGRLRNGAAAPAADDSVPSS